MVNVIKGIILMFFFLLCETIIRQLESSTHLSLPANTTSWINVVVQCICMESSNSVIYCMKISVVEVGTVLINII